jgi:hypothetical protein
MVKFSGPCGIRIFEGFHGLGEPFRNSERSGFTGCVRNVPELRPGRIRGVWINPNGGSSQV